jgi:hypothetical protein
MKRRSPVAQLKCIAAIIVLGVAVSVVLSLLTNWYFTVTSPRMVADGQYGMIFFFITGPLGWLVGSIAGVLIANRYFEHAYGSAPVAVFVVVVGLILSPPCLGLLPFMVIGWFLEHFRAGR